MALEPPVTLLPGWPIREDGLVMDAAGPVLAILLGPALTDKGWMSHCEALGRAIDARTEGVRVGVVYQVEAAYSRARASAVLEVIKPREGKLRETTAAFAYCTHSAMARTALRFVNAISPPPYPNATVKSVAHAYNFLARHLPGLDIEAYVSWHQRLAAAAGVSGD